jgi:hypothetical protein
MSETDKAETETAEGKQQEAKEGCERASDTVRYKVMNRVIPSKSGQAYRILIGKSTADPKKWIYLLRFVENAQDSFPLSASDDTQDIFSRLRALDNEQDSNSSWTLWEVEIVNDDGTINMRPYQGTDSNVLLKELLDSYVEHAFDTFENDD